MVMKKAFILLILVLVVPAGYSQDSAKVMISPYMNFQYFRNNGDSSYLKATLTYVNNRVEKPLTDRKLTFYSLNGEKIEEVSTNSKGIAICDLEREKLKTGSDGLWQFSVSFEGNDTIEAASSELAIKDAALTMECSEPDSVKTVALHLVKSEKGTMVPASGEAITVYVKRMFNPLPVGEITLDENGNGSIEFPKDIPGDLEGNIIIISKFDDHPEFGNVERRMKMQWGIPFIAQDHSSRRALWTKTAPKWMIYTLSILLAGVWGHYLFTFISLVRIKLSARKKTQSEAGATDIFIK
jgi:hypothetical protein